VRAARVNIKSNAVHYKWSAISNARRQSVYEHLASPIFVQHALYIGYMNEGSRKGIARIAEETRNGLKKTGVDLDTLARSDNGFATRRDFAKCLAG
jgi:hypothetical protein